MARILNRLSRPSPTPMDLDQNDDQQSTSSTRKFGDVSEPLGSDVQTERGTVFATTDDLITKFNFRKSETIAQGSAMEGLIRTPSLTMSSITPTSNDSSSDLLDAPSSGHARSRLAASGGRTSYATKGTKNATGRRDISGDTLIGDVSGEPIQTLLGDGIKALDLDWTVDALPGEDTAEAQRKLADGLKRRRSTRLELVDKVKDTVSTKLSVLGKRGRDAKGGASEKLHSLKRRATLRTKSIERADDAQQPPAKKFKLSQTTKITKDSISAPLEASKPSPVQKKKEKIWLKQGLYVGQSRTFDGKLTEAQNRAKSGDDEASRERTVLPMPMFFGEKLLKTGRDFKLPFDVFSPLPPGQPKPDEWKKCRKNVFIGDAASIWKDNALREMSRCLCTEDSGCDENCMNRYMLYECDEMNCNLSGDKCTNRAFADLKARTKIGRKYDIGVEVVKTENKGYGVRSNRTFQPGQIIVEYAGEIITQDECDRRMAKEYKDNECYYLMQFDQNMIIDATRGSIARFVNHSCEPNCRMIKWTVAGKPRMALFAGDKGIMTAEELTYDYKFEAFSIKNDQKCYCGSDRCRGSLGGRPKEVPKEAKLSKLASKKKSRKVNKEKVRAMLLQASSGRVKKGVSKSKSKVNQLRAKSAVNRAKIRAKAANDSKGVKGSSRSKAAAASRAVASVRRNVVTTVRGRGGGRVMANENGSTIRIIDSV